MDWDGSSLNRQPLNWVAGIVLYWLPIKRQDATLSTQDQEPTQPNGPSSDAEISSVIVARLADRIGQARFELWFSDSDAVQFCQGQITVQADSNFSLNRLQNSFAKDLREIADSVCGSQVAIEFAIRPVQPTKTPPSKKPQPNQACLFELQSSEGDQENNSQKALSRSSVNDARQGSIDLCDNGRGTVADDRLIGAGVENGPHAQGARRSPGLVGANREAQSAKQRGLNSFWLGENNRIARAGVEQILALPGQFSPLLVHGPSGSGKTHLLEAITNDYRRRLRKKRCLRLSAEQFTSHFVSSLRDNTGLPVFRKKYRDLDLLAIDDIQFFAGKKATLNEFQHTLDTLINLGRQIVVTSDRPLLELECLGADLLNRLSGGLTCPLMYPDLQGRIVIVEQMCRRRGFSLPKKVVELIASKITRDVRRLSGAVNRLIAVAISTETKTISPDFAASALKDLLALSTGGTSMANIEEAVCEFSGLKPADLRSTSRRKMVSSVRMLAMFLARTHTNSALSEIGDYFGGRSHSTVIAAHKKIDNLIAGDAEITLASSNYPIKDAIERIESKLRLG